MHPIDLPAHMRGTTYVALLAAWEVGTGPLKTPDQARKVGLAEALAFHHDDLPMIPRLADAISNLFAEIDVDAAGLIHIDSLATAVGSSSLARVGAHLAGLVHDRTDGPAVYWTDEPHNLRRQTIRLAGRRWNGRAFA